MRPHWVNLRTQIRQCFKFHSSAKLKSCDLFIATWAVTAEHTSPCATSALLTVIVMENHMFCMILMENHMFCVNLMENHMFCMILMKNHMFCVNLMENHMFCMILMENHMFCVNLMENHMFCVIVMDNGMSLPVSAQSLPVKLKGRWLVPVWTCSHQPLLQL
ncbi:hypothetical protein BsWGS_07117 [Bradybaena similaris]